MDQIDKFEIFREMLDEIIEINTIVITNDKKYIETEEKDKLKIYITENLKIKNLEEKLSTLDENSLLEIINKEYTCIDWEKFSDFYLDKIQYRETPELTLIESKIINHPKFIISDYYLVTGIPIIEIYINISPKKIRLIVEKLISPELPENLVLFKFYEALHYYFPQEIVFQQLFCKYSKNLSKLLNDDKKCSNKTLIIIREFVREKRNIIKDLFCFFREAEYTRLKTFQEILNLSYIDYGHDKLPSDMLIMKNLLYANQIYMNIKNQSCFLDSEKKEMKQINFSQYYEKYEKRVMKEIKNKRDNK